MTSIPSDVGSPSCPPLFAAAHLNIYRENTFRITGLPIDASDREIMKQAAGLKMLEEFGAAEAAVTHAYALRPPPGVEQIRSAMQRLKEPEHRLIDEFFWFWPREFGKSDHDPAIQALQRGDATTAHELWNLEAEAPKVGYVAIHNLAILYHLVALDWTLEDLKATVDPEREAKIEQYWRKAFEYWEQVATHDDVWGALKSRVQTIDDARLTTGFIRRMRTFLPEAFDKINAEAALRFAEAGRMDWARKHVAFMNETHQGLDDVEKTALLVLTPTRKRVKQLIQSAEEELNADPNMGLSEAEKLISTCRPLLALFNLFHGQESHHQAELFDEVASHINICLVEYDQINGLKGENINLLEAALEFATADHLRTQISKNIAIWQDNARFEKVTHYYKKLDAIDVSDARASQRLALVRGEIVSAIYSLRGTNEDAEAADDLAEATVIILRGISVDAHNEEDDCDTAISAIQLAMSLTSDAQFRAKLHKDLEAIQKTLNAVNSDKFELFIRNDRIHITHKAFTYRDTTVPISDITGIALEVANFSDRMDGKTSYEIKLTVPKLKGGELIVRCKRFMRSETQAQADFTAVAQAVVRFVMPKLLRTVVAALLAGKTERIGLCLVSRHGITLFPLGKTSYVATEDQPFTPWNELHSVVAQGMVAVFDAAAINQTPAATAQRLFAGQALLSGKGVVMEFSYTNALLLDGIVSRMTPRSP
jgi:hypothetical protein